jgi:NAD(P)-dependent dehydrogenase (short-subunit alcohol dehydrogenase family)
MMEVAREGNPFRRLTTPADVAAAIAVLCQAGTHWMTGNTIGVDGGEDVVA